MYGLFFVWVFVQETFQEGQHWCTWRRLNGCTCVCTAVNKFALAKHCVCRVSFPWSVLWLWCSPLLCCRGGDLDEFVFIWQRVLQELEEEEQAMEESRGMMDSPPDLDTVPGVLMAPTKPKPVSHSPVFPSFSLSPHLSFFLVFLSMWPAVRDPQTGEFLFHLQETQHCQRFCL